MESTTSATERQIITFDSGTLRGRRAEVITVNRQNKRFGYESSNWWINDPTATMGRRLDLSGTPDMTGGLSQIFKQIDRDRKTYGSSDWGAKFFYDGREILAVESRGWDSDGAPKEWTLAIHSELAEFLVERRNHSDYVKRHPNMHISDSGVRDAIKIAVEVPDEVE